MKLDKSFIEKITRGLKVLPMVSKDKKPRSEPELNHEINNPRYKDLLISERYSQIARLDRLNLDSYQIAEIMKIKAKEIQRIRLQLKVAAIDGLQELIGDLHKPADKPKKEKAVIERPSMKKEVEELQRRMISEFHEVSIRLDRKLELAIGDFKRHSRGGLLSPLALKLLPPEYRLVFEQEIEEKGVKLCYINGVVMTIPSDYFKLVKK